MNQGRDEQPMCTTGTMSPTGNVRIFLGVPVGADAKLWMTTVKSLFEAATSKFKVTLVFSEGSALTMNFNGLIANAINHNLNSPPEEQFNYFMMIHTDMAPEPGWIGKMVEAIQQSGADILCAHSPIKDSRGLSSTAIDTDPWTPRRLTMHEIHSLPFDEIDSNYCMSRYGYPLLPNTGLMIVRLDPAWMSEITFGIKNEIAYKDGRAVVRFASEDWEFGRWANARGLKVAATRRVKLHHCGNAMYTNAEAWGENKVDEANIVNSEKEKAGF